MPTNPTYPGIYIEELPNNSHSITPAPTSVTVFIGYTHPFKTPEDNFNKAVQIFSFTEYERNFGGLYSSDYIEAHVAYAVNQFFLNGGSEAYVVALKPFYQTAGGAVEFAAATLQLGANLVLSALEPVDDNNPLTVLVTNPQNNPVDTADFTISYGSRTEIYRKVKFDKVRDRLGTKDNPISSLVSVDSAIVSGAPIVTPLINKPAQVDKSLNLVPVIPAMGALNSAFSSVDFASVFEQDSSLDKVDIFNLMVVPGVSDNGVLNEALAFCEQKHAFLIMDPPKQHSADGERNTLPLIGDYMENSGFVPKSPNGALYFPYLKSIDPLDGKPMELPPSGFVAGLFARTDLNRGVWKAPAGLETTLLNTTGVVDRGRMNDLRHGTLNPMGVNVLRTFPGVGTVIYGARTLTTENTAFEQWRYIPVRRMALFIEQTLLRNLGWVVFEPNDEPLWTAIRISIENFMLSLFTQHAFQGATPSVAFRVVCDSTTTTQTDINRGIVNILVAFCPLKPAEFVIVKIAQLAGQTQV